MLSCSREHSMLLWASLSFWIIIQKPGKSILISEGVFHWSAYNFVQSGSDHHANMWGSAQHCGKKSLGDRNRVRDDFTFLEAFIGAEKKKKQQHLWVWVLVCIVSEHPDLHSISLTFQKLGQKSRCSSSDGSDGCLLGWQLKCSLCAGRAEPWAFHSEYVLDWSNRFGFGYIFYEHFFNILIRSFRGFKDFKNRSVLLQFPSESFKTGFLPIQFFIFPFCKIEDSWANADSLYSPCSEFAL